MSSRVPTEQITKSNWNSGPKQRVSGIAAGLPSLLAGRIVDLSLEYDSHDHTIDSNCFTEDDTTFCKLYLTRFLERMRGALTAAPSILAPAM